MPQTSPCQSRLPRPFQTGRGRRFRHPAYRRAPVPGGMVVAPRAGVPAFAFKGHPQAGSAVHERLNPFAAAGQVNRKGPPHRRHHQSEFSLSDQGLGTKGGRVAAPRSVRVIIVFNELMYFESPPVFARGADLSLTMMYVGVHGPDQGRTGTLYVVPADGHGPHNGHNGTITGDQIRKQCSQDKPHLRVWSAITCRSRWRSHPNMDQFGRTGYRLSSPPRFKSRCPHHTRC